MLRHRVFLYLFNVFFALASGISNVKERTSFFAASFSQMITFKKRFPQNDDVGNVRNIIWPRPLALEKGCIAFAI